MIQTAIFDFDGTLVDSMFIRDTAEETDIRSSGKDQLLSYVQLWNIFENLLWMNKLIASSGTLGAPPYATIENNAEKRKEYAK